MDVPTEDDWRSEPWSLDTRCAFNHFFGLTIDEATKLFEECAIVYQEDAMFMPGRVFVYYVRALIAYLMSERAAGDADAASGFLSLIQFKSEWDPQDLIPVWPEIESTLKMLALHQERFEAEWEIYGCFRTRIDEIVQHGFAVSFDTKAPEIVPADVTLAVMAGTHRTVSPAIAEQVFRNSGLHGITATSTRTDVVRILGAPDDASGGDHPQFGPIPIWIRYHRPDCTLRFELGDERITAVTFMPPGQFGNNSPDQARRD